MTQIHLNGYMIPTNDRIVFQYESTFNITFKNYVSLERTKRRISKKIQDGTTKWISNIKHRFLKSSRMGVNTLWWI